MINKIKESKSVKFTEKSRKSIDLDKFKHNFESLTKENRMLLYKID